MATIHQNLETISLASHSSPARTSSPALVMSPHASTSAAPSSRVSPRQRANESHTTGAKAGQGESVFNRLYHVSFAICLACSMHNSVLTQCMVVPVHAAARAESGAAQGAAGGKRCHQDRRIAEDKIYRWW
eukprot:284448-Rhodomonas_salina.1